jgi:hypothetical protein
VSSKDGGKAAASGFKRIQAHKSGPWDFENVQFGQDLSGHHCGPIWCMKFSLCGRLLATAGSSYLRVSLENTEIACFCGVGLNVVHSFAHA